MAKQFQCLSESYIAYKIVETYCKLLNFDIVSEKSANSCYVPYLCYSEFI